MNDKLFTIYDNKLPASINTKITVEFEFMCICPIPTTPKTFGGIVKIKYVPRIESKGHRLLEWDSFNEWIKSLRNSIMSAENMAHTIISMFIQNIDPREVTLYMEVRSPHHLPVSITLTYYREGE